MSYETELAQIAREHQAQIEADLVSAQAALEAAQDELEKSARRVHMLECLTHVNAAASALAENSESIDPAEKLTLHAAMHHVLQNSPTGKLRAGDIIAEIGRRNLYRMKDGRLPESQQIHARASHYPNLFGKEGSFFFAK